MATAEADNSWVWVCHFADHEPPSALGWGVEPLFLKREDFNLQKESCFDNGGQAVHVRLSVAEGEHDAEVLGP